MNGKWVQKRLGGQTGRDFLIGPLVNAGGAAFAICLALLGIEASAATISPGDILLVDFRDSVLLGPDQHALFRVDPVTGDREIVSGQGVGSGEDVSAMLGLAVSSGGQIYVTDSGGAIGTSAVLRIDPATGNRELISGRGRGAGPELRSGFGGPTSVAIGADGSLYVADVDEDFSGSIANGAIYRVDPATGNRTLISGLGIGAGADLRAPWDITLESSNTVLISDLGKVLRIDLTTGDRELVVSDTATDVIGFDAISGTSVLVTGQKQVTANDFDPFLGTLDLQTGTIEVLSGWDGSEVVGSGPLREGMLLDVISSGSQISASGDRLGAFLLNMSALSGDRTILSGVANPFDPIVIGSGPEIFWPGTLAIYQIPEPTTAVIALIGMAAMGLYCLSRRSSRPNPTRVLPRDIVAMVAGEKLETRCLLAVEVVGLVDDVNTNAFGWVSDVPDSSSWTKAAYFVITTSDANGAPNFAYFAHTDSNLVSVYRLDAQGRYLLEEGGANPDRPLQLITQGSDEQSDTSDPGLSRFVRPHSIAISPDGSHAYIATQGANGNGNDAALITMSRNSATGVLTELDWTFVATNQTGNQTLVSTLLGAAEVRISADGDNVYVTGRDGHSIVWFDRNTDTQSGNFGRLTYAGAIETLGDTDDYLDNARGLAISPDGDHIYVTARNANTLVSFARDQNGDLTVLSDDGGTTYKPRFTSGSGVTLATPTNVVLDPNGINVYVTSADISGTGANGSITVFARMTNPADAEYGELRLVEQFVDGVPDGDDPIDGLGGAINLAVSPDGRAIYVTGHTDAIESLEEGEGERGALTILSRDLTTGALTLDQVERYGFVSSNAARSGSLSGTFTTVANNLGKVRISTSMSGNGLRPDDFVSITGTGAYDGTWRVNSRTSVGFTIDADYDSNFTSFAGATWQYQRSRMRGAIGVAVSDDGRFIYTANYGKPVIPFTQGAVDLGDEGSLAAFAIKPTLEIDSPTYDGVRGQPIPFTFNVGPAGPNSDYSYSIDWGDRKGTVTSVASGTSGHAVITSANHRVKVGDKIVITGTTNYNSVGYWTVEEVVNANSFRIDDNYVANETSGHWTKLDIYTSQGSTLNVTHVYQIESAFWTSGSPFFGSYQIAATVTDAGGRTSDAATESRTIQVYELQTTSGVTNIVLGGNDTNAQDYLLIVSSSSVIQFYVGQGATSPALSISTSSVTGHIVVYGQGNFNSALEDIFVAQGVTTHRVEIHGGEGPDLIIGGQLGDWLYGDEGDDTIFGGALLTDGDDEIHGGSGDDVLYGHLGSDTLYGDEGEDMLWGGVVNFSNQQEQWTNVPDIWQNAEAYLERIEAITTGLVNGTLETGLANDNAADHLYGGIGALDWYIYRSEEDEIEESLETIGSVTEEWTDSRDFLG
jgi:sugar lactone lactonase YvrE